MKFPDRPYLTSVTVAAHKNKKHHEMVSKIKVPFYCMFSELNGNGKRKTEKKLGAVHREQKEITNMPSYILVDMSEQKSMSESNVVAKSDSVTDLIKKHGINIGKVEIIFWED